MATVDSTTTCEHDADNRLTGKTDPGSLSQAYVYDAVGNRTKLTDPDGNVRTYAYDALNRISTFVAPSGTTFSYQYDAAGRRTTLGQTSPTFKTKWTYDVVGNITSIQHWDGTGALVESFTFAYNSDDWPLWRYELNGTVTTYRFDNKFRLINENTTGTNPHNYTYTYDRNDNLLTNMESGSLVSNTYDGANRLVTTLNGTALTTYTYDVNGNLTVVQDGAASRTTMSYDKENRLSAHYGNDATIASYLYDGDGMKRIEIVQGTRTTITWDGEDYLQARS